MSSVLYPTVLHEVDRSIVSQNQVINISPGKGNIPLSFSSEPRWGALVYPKDYATGKNHFNEARQSITPTKYVHGTLKCCDNQFASNPQYMFHAWDYTEKKAVWNSITLAGQKQFRSEITAGQLVNQDNIQWMISDAQIFAFFKNVRGHHNIFTTCFRSWQFGIYIFRISMEWHYQNCSKLIWWSTQWWTSSGYGLEYNGIMLEKKSCHSCSADWLYFLTCFGWNHFEWDASHWQHFDFWWLHRI